ncbi:MAG TPA: NAD(P)/FAD-dependent oxidoreductase [Saprospiraceae bacterium]|nr:NAD(P)/FAD-dependent oxidoreductase [Saprospiraceae bacterium]
MHAIANIPETDKERVVVLGGGFAGLHLARKLSKKNFQVVLLDRNNFHSFQPLFYQVATSGLEPAAIAFPLRKIFQKQNHVHIRIAEVQEVDPERQLVLTNIGYLNYDHLVMALGADTNYFGNERIRRHAVPMKSLNEAIALRNNILYNYELALNEKDPERASALMNVVIVGAGPTGVELAGALAEMKRFILPKDYPELDFSKMRVQLLEAMPDILPGYSEQSSNRAERYLKKLGVEVLTNTMVQDYDGQKVTLKDAESLSTHTLIWAAGIQANTVNGLPDAVYGKNKRLIVNRYNQVKGLDHIYALGDMAYMETEDFKKGHPQVAQVALQQAKNLFINLVRQKRDKELRPFTYVDKGSLATIGRNLAVADLPAKIRLGGAPAWLLWLFIHLMALVGVKNRLLVFINWAINYFTYDQSLRLLIRPQSKIKKADILEETKV